MKKLQFFTMFTVITIIAIVIVIKSCKKEDYKSANEMKNKNEKVTKTGYKADLTEKKILNFNKKVKDYKKDPGSKEFGSKILPGDALWITEASLNYNFADLDSTWEKAYKDTFYISLPVENDSIVYSQLINAYLTMEGNIDQYLDEINGDHVRMLLSDLSISGDSKTQDEIIFEQQVLVASGVFIVPFCTFEDDDYWYWGEEQGRCGEYQGQDIGMDAAKIINQKLNACKGQPAGNHYYTDIETNAGNLWGCANENMFCEWGDPPNHAYCMSPQEMAGYFNYTRSWAQDHTPDGKVIMNYFYDYDYITATNSYGLIHYCDIQYGVLHLTGNDM